MYKSTTCRICDRMVGANSLNKLKENVRTHLLYEHPQEYRKLEECKIDYTSGIDETKRNFLIKANKLISEPELLLPP